MNPLAALGGIAVISAIAFVGGWKVASDHYTALGAKQVVRTVYVTQKVGQIATQAATQAQAAHDQIVYRTKTIIERVHDEIPPASDVELSAVWLREYNASLGLPADAGPAVALVDPPRGLPSADALAVIADNNGQCAARSDQLNRVLDFYAAVKSQINVKP